MVNLCKSSLSTIAVDVQVTDEIAKVLDCKVAVFPFTYLGLPLSSKALPKASLHSMVDSVAKKLPACHGPLMTRSGRLVWIKSVLMAMPVFAMISYKLPAWVREEIDAICRKFLWAGTDGSVRGKCLVSWPIVTRPTEHGGLGVPDLRLTSIALQTRWLWLQRTDENRVWSGLPIQVASEVRAFFAASIFIQVGNGRRTLFWRAARRGGLTVQVIAEYINLWDRLEGFQLQPEVEDRVVWRWAENGVYCTRSAYRALHLGSQVFPEYQLIWQSWLPLRVKIFLWLASRQRIWTGDRRRRHGLDARELCWLCNLETETCDHIRFKCQFSMQLWSLVLMRDQVQLPSSDACSGLLDWWKRFRIAWPALMRKGADTLFGLGCWIVWKERNRCCFSVRETADLWIIGGARNLALLHAGR
ncbi:hypothetical protein BS78_05G233700 [Paspalum vaginatum]|nr:hypothetical protein BS78_05G233700 [Paspalum vaginatum]